MRCGPRGVGHEARGVQLGVRGVRVLCGVGSAMCETAVVRIVLRVSRLVWGGSWGMGFGGWGVAAMISSPAVQAPRGATRALTARMVPPATGPPPPSPPHFVSFGPWVHAMVLGYATKRFKLSAQIVGEVRSVRIFT